MTLLIPWWRLWKGLAILCEAWADVVRFGRLVRRKGGYYTTSPSGHRQVSPEVTLYKNSVDRYIKLADRFGMTPAARQQLCGFLWNPEVPAEPAAGGGDGEHRDDDKTEPGGKVLRMADRTGRPIG